MTYREFKRRLGKSGLTVREYAGLLHMSHKGVSNYAKAGTHVSKMLAVSVTLMAEMAKHDLDFKHVLEDLDIVAGAPRGLPDPTFIRRVVTRKSKAVKEKRS